MTNTFIVKIQNLLNKSVQAHFQACQLIAEYCQKNSTNNLDVETALRLNNNLVYEYIEVGTGRIKPELSFYRCCGHDKLKKMSRAKQEALYGKTVPVAVRKNHDWYVEDVAISALSCKQANLVFTAGYQRSVEEQIAHAEALAQRKTQTTIDASYTVVSEGIILHHAGSRLYTKAELKALLKLCK